MPLAMASRSSRSRSYSTTSAPYALVRSRLDSGASAGITMVACIFRICAAAATPWAWLPDENATTPPPRASCGIDDSLLKAPRNLNDPVRCSISGFRKTLVPARSSSAGDDNSGVRTANGARTRAAASTSVELTGKIEAGSIIRALYRVRRDAGKTLGGGSGDETRALGCEWHGIAVRIGGADSGDIFDEGPGRRLPGVPRGEFEAGLRRNVQRGQARQ